MSRAISDHAQAPFVWRKMGSKSTQKKYMIFLSSEKQFLNADLVFSSPPKTIIISTSTSSLFLSSMTAAHQRNQNLQPPATPSQQAPPHTVHIHETTSQSSSCHCYTGTNSLWHGNPSPLSLLSLLVLAFEFLAKQFFGVLFVNVFFNYHTTKNVFHKFLRKIIYKKLFSK